MRRQHIYISDYSTHNLHKCDLCSSLLPLKYAIFIIIARRYRINFILHGVYMCVFWIKELVFEHNAAILVFIQHTTDIHVMSIQDGGHINMKLAQVCVSSINVGEHGSYRSITTVMFQCSPIHYHNIFV